MPPPLPGQAGPHACHHRCRARLVTRMPPPLPGQAGPALCTSTTWWVVPHAAAADSGWSRTHAHAASQAGPARMLPAYLVGGPLMPPLPGKGCLIHPLPSMVECDPPFLVWWNARSTPLPGMGGMRGPLHAWYARNRRTTADAWWFRNAARQNKNRRRHHHS